MDDLNRRLRGHYNYYGLRGSSRSLYRFYGWAVRCAYKWFNRRGGKRMSFTWKAFNRAIKRFGIVWLRRLRRRSDSMWCMHRVFNRAQESTTEEPGAGKLHAGDCAGGAG